VTFGAFDSGRGGVSGIAADERKSGESPNTAVIVKKAEAEAAALSAVADAAGGFVRGRAGADCNSAESHGMGESTRREDGRNPADTKPALMSSADDRKSARVGM
jgi:hypothetical protein